MDNADGDAAPYHSTLKGCHRVKTIHMKKEKTWLGLNGCGHVFLCLMGVHDIYKKKGWFITYGK